MLEFDIVNKAGKLDYTLASWKTLQAACVSKAELLNAKQDEEDPEYLEWTPVLVERAAWADSAIKSK